MPVLHITQRISVSEPPFVGEGWLRINVCDSSLANWKALSRLPICYNCTFLLDLMTGTNASKSAFVEGVDHFGDKYYVQGLC